jgi:hypothetical protein
MVSHVVDLGLITAQAVEQREAFDAGLLFARTEGLVPAPESCHAVAGAIAEARRRADTGEAGVLVVGLSGNGQLDLPAYAEHLTGARTPATGTSPSDGPSRPGGTAGRSRPLRRAGRRDRLARRPRTWPRGPCPAPPPDSGQAPS